jgi:hypothetical protein
MKTNITLLIILPIVFFFINAFAGPDLSSPPIDVHPSLSQSGQLFTIKIIPGKKQTQFFIVGNKAAEISFENLELEGRLILPGQFQPLKLEKSKDHFVIYEMVTGKIDLKVKSFKKKAKTNAAPAQEESFQIQLPASP